MSDTNYAGIDYGMGQANIDKATGIRFGVINANAEGLTEWVHEEFEPDYGDPTCGNCGNDAVEYDDDKHGEYKCERGACSDYACETCERVFDSSDAYGDEPNCWVLDDGEYKAIMGQDDNDIMILKAPYWTRAQYCSPCAPGAGHLENPCPTGPRTYCFGHDWFRSGRAPYPVFRVSDDSEVLSDAPEAPADTDTDTDTDHDN